MVVQITTTDTERVLRKLLNASGPEKAARLKQRMIAEFGLEGSGRFDERALGYPKFKDFLQKAHADLVALAESEGGDMVVSLVHGAPGIEPQIASPPEPIIRSDIWQAFANPDPDRKRLFNKVSADVVHFKATDEPKQSLEWLNNSAVVPIEPIQGEVQKRWMEDFLGTVRLSDDQRQALSEFTKQRYSSALNLTFTRALGENAALWKRVRQTHILNAIRQWAENNSVPMDVLHRRDRLTNVATAKMVETPSITPVRQRVLTLLEILSDQDLERAVLPLLAAVVLLQERN
jgi:hypothetical protein